MLVQSFPEFEKEIASRKRNFWSRKNEIFEKLAAMFLEDGAVRRRLGINFP